MSALWLEDNAAKTNQQGLALDIASVKLGHCAHVRKHKMLYFSNLKRLSQAKDKRCKRLRPYANHANLEAHIDPNFDPLCLLKSRAVSVVSHMILKWEQDVTSASVSSQMAMLYLARFMRDVKGLRKSRVWAHDITVSNIIIEWTALEAFKQVHVPWLSSIMSETPTTWSFESLL